jgi:hypothetical protein
MPMARSWRDGYGPGRIIGCCSTAAVVRGRSRIDTCQEVPSVTHVERESIQPGWSVWASDGEELGAIIRVEPDKLVVKKGGLISHEMNVPRDAVTEVETGRVELGMTRGEIESAGK